MGLQKMALTRVGLLRGYCTAAQGVPVGGLRDVEIKSEMLPTKMTVAAVENHSPITRICIAFKAGSRYETAETLGVTHMIRIAGGLSTKSFTQFGIMRNLQQIGTNITLDADREVISYTLQGPGKAVRDSLQYFKEIATCQVFRPWEISDNIYRVRLDLNFRSPLVRLFDGLHRAAYHDRGLGNSLFILKGNVGYIQSETMQHYYTQNFALNRMAVTGTGISYEELLHFAESLDVDPQVDKGMPSAYGGGDSRSYHPGEYVYVAIGGEGAPLTNTKEMLTCGILKYILGADSSIPYKSYGTGIVGKSLAPCGLDAVGLSAFSLNYVDTGLVGVTVASPCENAGKYVEAIVKVLRCGDFSDEDVSRAKSQLKGALLIASEDPAQLLADITKQATLMGCVQSSQQLAAGVDEVTSADVNAALKKMSRNLTIASVGDLRSVPYLSDVK